MLDISTAHLGLHRMRYCQRISCNQRVGNITTPCWEQTAVADDRTPSSRHQVYCTRKGAGSQQKERPPPRHPARHQGYQGHESAELSRSITQSWLQTLARLESSCSIIGSASLTGRPRTPPPGPSRPPYCCRLGPPLNGLQRVTSDPHRDPITVANSSSRCRRDESESHGGVCVCVREIEMERKRETFDSALF